MFVDAEVRCVLAARVVLLSLGTPSVRRGLGFDSPAPLAVEGRIDPRVPRFLPGCVNRIRDRAS